MDLKSLNYFLAVCKHHSFTRAARESYISPQGLRKSIHILEHELGVPLFVKTENGKELTKFGKCFYDYAEHMLSDYQQMQNDLTTLAAPKHDRIRIAFSYGTIGSLGVEVLLEFQKQYPYIELIYGDYTDLICDQELRDGRYDLAFTIAPFDEDCFHTIPLKREKICFWVNHRNPLSQKESVTFEDIKNEKLMMVGQEFKAYKTFIHECRKRKIIPNLILTTSEMGLLRQMVAENQGIAQTVEHEVYLAADSQIISCVPLEHVYWSYGISYCKDRILNDNEMLFLKFILNQYLI